MSLLDNGIFGFILDDKTGFIFCNRVMDEAEIYTVCVIPECRRQGKAGKLLDTALQYAEKQGIKKFFLEVNENNIAALALYRSRGFINVGYRKDYYTNGKNKENAIIMEKII